MGVKKVYLCLKDESYGRRLLNYLIDRSNYQLQYELVTSVDGLIELDENTYCVTDFDESQVRTVSQIIYLSEEKNDRDIYKYQKVRGIYEELMSRLEMTVEDKKKGVYVVFATGEKEAETVALSLCEKYSRKGRCVYVPFLNFSICEALVEERHNSYLGDLIFCDEEREFQQLVQMAERQLGEVFVLPGWKHYRDFLDCKAKEISDFLERLQRVCEFDTVVVSVSQCNDDFLNVLERFNEVIWVSEESELGEVRKRIFERYCKVEKNSSLEAKWTEVKWDEEYEKRYQELSIGAKEWGQ